MPKSTRYSNPIDESPTFGDGSLVDTSKLVVKIAPIIEDQSVKFNVANCKGATEISKSRRLFCITLPAVANESERSPSFDNLTIDSKSFSLRGAILQAHEGVQYGRVQFTHHSIRGHEKRRF